MNSHCTVLCRSIDTAGIQKFVKAFYHFIMGMTEFVCLPADITAIEGDTASQELIGGRCAAP
jgi:hypothetical protein